MILPSACWFDPMQVHSYVAVPGGRTAYLAELRSGSEVLVADANGRTQTALVGRCKIERRPLVSPDAVLPRKLM
jgi:3-dehydroquinate synthase class II